jgi:hypothetical protein
MEVALALYPLSQKAVYRLINLLAEIAILIMSALVGHLNSELGTLLLDLKGLSKLSSGNIDRPQHH